MKKRRFPLFADSFLIFLISLIATILLLSPLKISFLWRFVICFIFSACIALFIFIYNGKKYQTQILSQKYKKQFDLMLFNLELMTDSQINSLFKDLFTKLNLPFKVKDEHLYLNGAICIFDFSKIITRAQFCEKIKGLNVDKAILFCNEINEDCNEIIEVVKNKIIIITSQRLFAVMKKNNFEFPNTSAIKTNNKGYLRAFLNKTFTKKRALGFAVLSAISLLFSFITFFPNYYKISSLIFLCLSLFCLIFGKREKKEEDNIFSFE